MKARGNRRLLIASSTGVENTPPTTMPAATDPGSAGLWNSRHIYADMRRMGRVVRDSRIGFVTLRPGFMMPRAPRNDIELVVDEAARPAHTGQVVGLYSAQALKWGENADRGAMAQQSRAAGSATPETAAVAPVARRGDADRGRGLAETCVPCHGAAGVSDSPAFPIIAGPQYDYLVGAMLAYLSGTRQDSIMSGSIRTLPRSSIEDLAAYYSSLRGLGSVNVAAPGNAVGANAAPAATPTTTSAAAASPGSPPGGALAAAQAAADAARQLRPPMARSQQHGRHPDAAELRACTHSDPRRVAGTSVQTPGKDLSMNQVAWPIGTAMASTTLTMPHRTTSQSLHSMRTATASSRSATRASCAPSAGAAQRSGCATSNWLLISISVGSRSSRSATAASPTTA